jgi:hypothetical protein
VAAIAGKHAAASKRADRRALKERLDPIRAGKPVGDKRKRGTAPPFSFALRVGQTRPHPFMIKSLEMLYSLPVMAQRLLGFRWAVSPSDIHPSKKTSLPLCRAFSTSSRKSGSF